MDAFDDVHLAKKNTDLFSWIARTAALRIVTSTVYLIIRIKHTLDAQSGLFILDKLVAWVFLLIEIGFAGKDTFI